MSPLVRRIGFLALLAGCAAEDGTGTGESEGSGSSSTAALDTSVSTTAGATTNAGTSESSDGGEASTGDPGPSDESEGDASTGNGEDGGSGDETDGEVAFDEEFVWVADFLRTNCVACHSAGMNGNLMLSGPDITNDEIRLALDGVIATTGLKLVEPGDRQASQTWLQITNEFGAQFPIEDTDRFGAWIDAGAVYFAP